MKLSVREQQVLADLEHDLVVTDPDLANLFVHASVQPLTFTDPTLADLYARLFARPRHARRPWLLRTITERRRLRTAPSPRRAGRTIP
jgi:hypothetical protein